MQFCKILQDFPSKKSLFLSKKFISFKKIWYSKTAILKKELSEDFSIQKVFFIQKICSESDFSDLRNKQKLYFRTDCTDRFIILLFPFIINFPDSPVRTRKTFPFRKIFSFITVTPCKSYWKNTLVQKSFSSSKKILFITSALQESD